MCAAWRYLCDERGALAGEYALILSILGLAILMAALVFGDAISTSFNQSSHTIANAGAPDDAAAQPAMTAARQR